MLDGKKWTRRNPRPRSHACAVGLEVLVPYVVLVEDEVAVPYRCLYSRNIPNLFMAGRDISVTHIALGTTRLMRKHDSAVVY